MITPLINYLYYFICLSNLKICIFNVKTSYVFQILTKFQFFGYPIWYPIPYPKFRISEIRISEISDTDSDIKPDIRISLVLNKENKPSKNKNVSVHLLAIIRLHLVRLNASYLMIPEDLEKSNSNY